MKKMKKLLSLFLALCMVMSMVYTTALADDGDEPEQVEVTETEEPKAEEPEAEGDGEDKTDGDVIDTPEEDETPAPPALESIVIEPVGELPSPWYQSQSIQLRAVLQPEGAEGEVIWTIGNGTKLSLTPGENGCTVTCITNTSTAADKVVTASVGEVSATYTLPNSTALPAFTYSNGGTIYVGQTTEVTSPWENAGLPTEDLAWTFSNDINVASGTPAEGKVTMTALSAGSNKVTVALSGVEKAATISGKQDVRVDGNPDNLKLMAGQEYTLTAPHMAELGDVVWAIVGSATPKESATLTVGDDNSATLTLLDTCTKVTVSATVTADGKEYVSKPAFTVSPADKAAYEVDGRTFADLTAAVNAATDGDTVTLLTDTNAFNNNITVNKDLTIDLNDHALTATNKTITVAEGKALEIKGGTVTNGAYTVNGTLELTDATVSRANTVIVVNATGKLELDEAEVECTVTASGNYYAVQLAKAGASAEITNSTIKGGRDIAGSALYMVAGTWAEINGECSIAGPDGGTATHNDAAFQVGDMYYADLKTAVEAAANAEGKTVKLVCNNTAARTNANVTVDGDVTIDLNGYTLNANAKTITVAEGKALEIKGGQATNGGYTVNGSLTVTDATVSRANTVIVVNATGKLELDEAEVECTVTASGNYYAVQLAKAGASAKITRSTIKGGRDIGGSALYMVAGTCAEIDNASSIAGPENGTAAHNDAAFQVGTFYYADLKTAVEAAANADGKTVKLVLNNTKARSAANVTVDEDVTIDLNGYTLDANNRTVTVAEGKTLEIVDSSENKTGLATNGYYVVNGAMNVTDTTVSRAGTVVTVNANGKLELDNATVECTAAANAVRLAQAGAAAEVKDSTISCTNAGAAGLSAAASTTVTVKDSKIESAGYGIRLDSNGANSETPTTATITNSTISGDAQFGIQANNYCKLTVESSTVTSANGTAISASAARELRILGPQTKVEGPTALKLTNDKTASAVIENGTFTGTGADGKALWIDASVAATVKGGDFNAANGDAIYMGKGAKLTVDNGRFNGKNALNADNTDLPVLNLNGGTFTGSVTVLHEDYNVDFLKTSDATFTDGNISKLLYGACKLEEVNGRYKVIDRDGTEEDNVVFLDGKGYATFRAAVEAANANGGGTIVVPEGTTVYVTNSGTAPVRVLSTITLTGGGTVKRGVGNTGCLIHVGNVMSMSSTGNLTLENITLDGGAVWTGDVDPVLGRGTVNTGLTSTQAMIRVDGMESSLILKAGAVMENNDDVSTNVGVCGGAVKVDYGATLEMYDGAVIRNNAGSFGGAIKFDYVSKVPVISGGEIYGNASNLTSKGEGGYGGAIVLDSYLDLRNVTIRNNWAAKSGGAIYSFAVKQDDGTIDPDNPGVLNIHEGTVIRDNVANDGNGGGLYISSGTVTMDGGSISGNVANNGSGGGLCIYSATVAITGGSITGNRNSGASSTEAMSCFAINTTKSNLTISGGTFDRQVSNYVAEGYVEIDNNGTWTVMLVPVVTPGPVVGDTEIDDDEVPLAGDAQLNRDDHFAYVSGYTDGTVRPTNNITREEVAAIFYRLLTDTSRAIYETDVNDFSDVASNRWSNKAISTLANAGIISGYPDGTFRPDQTITRAEFAAIAARFDAVTDGLENPFSDTTGHWAESLISYAASRGWVSGYPDGTFQPQKAITRAEAMTMINNVLNREVDKEGLLAEATQWPDNQEGAWYYYEVLEATNSHDYKRRVDGEPVESWTAITK